MNLTTIQTAHTLDFAIQLAGQLTSLAVLTTIQYPELEVEDHRRPFRRTIPDHLLIHGRLAGGGALAVQVVGGRPAGDTPFRMDITGADGALTIDGGAARGFQAGRLRLSLDSEPVQLDQGRPQPCPTPSSTSPASTPRCATTSTATSPPPRAFVTPPACPTSSTTCSPPARPVRRSRPPRPGR